MFVLSFSSNLLVSLIVSNNIQPIKNYNLAMGIIHWASGLILLAMICSGFYMVSYKYLSWYII
jgi:hypothetical protein